MTDLDELIAEAREWANGHPNRRSGELMRDLADALEARQPSENDREALVRVVANHPIAPLMRLGGDAGYLLADAILAAGFSRAAVPDAATDVREYLHAKCDCVPDLGPAHCHLCSADGSPVEWANCVAVQQVTDAPETVEVAFKTVEVERLGHLLVQLSPATPRNGAATVRRLMEEMNIKEVVS